MQVNPVHALIGLLRTEAQRGILGREQKLQLNALADILLEARDAKDRLGKLEEAIQKGEIKQTGVNRTSVNRTGMEKAEIKQAGWHDFEHEGDTPVSPRDFSVRVANATSDAMARALTERHGRTWDSYPSNDNATREAAAEGPRNAQGAAQHAHHDPNLDMPPGFAFPFRPTVEDVEHALKTGQGWPSELGEEVRLRILRESRKDEAQDTAAYPFWPFVIVVMLAAAVVLWLI